VIVDELQVALPPATVVTDPDIVEAYRFDRATTVDPGRQLAVVCPSDVSNSAPTPSKPR
jgi:hypothetical protein